MNPVLRNDEIFRWSDGFNIGLSEIDHQHARLVEILNRLASYHVSRTSSDGLLQVFDELLDYTAYHFASEDKVMRDHSVDRAHIEVHRQAHQKFIEQAATARRIAESAPYEATGDTLAFLTNWLIHHILCMDRRLAFEIRRAEETAGKPISVGAIPDAEHTIDMLIVAIDSLYDRLGKNAAELRGTNRRLEEELARTKNAEEELRVAATAFEAQEAILIANARGLIVRVNRAFSDITGYSAEEVIGRNPRILSSGHQSRDFYEAMWQAINATGRWQGEIWNRRKNGETYPAWLSITAVTNHDGLPTHFVGTSTDIAPRKLAEDRIKNLAYFDQLTQLPNRRLMMDRLDQALSMRTRHNRHGALLLVDLDDFKSLNDSMGHGVGDSLLVQVAQRLKSSVRDEDTVARLGGDDFAIIVGDLGSGDQAPMQVELLAAKLQESIAKSHTLEIIIDGVVSGSCRHSTTCSIGVAMFHDRSVRAEDLLTRAETAMYRAKKAGRQSHRFFDSDMQELVVRRTSLERDLRYALEERQLELHYQAQVGPDDSVVGAEALVRWHHPERGMIEPGEFIPLAEETGLILPLGHWVIEEGCKRLAEWAGNPEMATLTLAVNVSAKHFAQLDFVDEVLSLVDQYHVMPDRLKIELTESHFLDNAEEVIERMRLLKARNVGFSMDDFGTGYSSLAYLKRLPLDQLKIDQSFVRDILDHANDAAIAKAIVALAQSLGLSVIAEGVETEGQRAFLMQNGCPTCQGYLFSRPEPLAEFEAFAARHFRHASNRRWQDNDLLHENETGALREGATTARSATRGIVVMAIEIIAISFMNYSAATARQYGMPDYISLDVLYCLPIIQAARMASISDLFGHSDSNISTLIGISIACAWSVTEVAIVWPDFPLTSAMLNIFTRSVVLTLLSRVVLTLWRSSSLANRDPLTNLSNRRDLFARLKAERGRSARTGKPFSLLYIDLDNFKSVNDIYGHDAGDEALKLMANLLKKCSREIDVPARIGGDEFVLLLPSTESKYCNVLIKRIEVATAECFLNKGWPISVSIGQSTSDGRNFDVESLVQSADRSMYRSKRNKRVALAC